MKTSDKKTEKIFNDGAATSLIEWANSNLPNIMLYVAGFLRVGIGIIIYMHTEETLSVLKDKKIASVIAFIFVVPVEILLTSTSFASAGLWKRSRLFMLDGEKEKANEYFYWGIFFFVTTLLGSLVFNALMLSWANESGGEASKYFNKVGEKQGIQLLVIVQVMNVIAVVASEGSAFLLNSNYSKSPVTPTTSQKGRESAGSNSTVTQQARDLRFANIHT